MPDSRSRDDRIRPLDRVTCENGGGSASASCGPVSGNLVDLQTLDGHGDVGFGDVEGGRALAV